MRMSHLFIIISVALCAFLFNPGSDALAAAGQSPVVAPAAEPATSGTHAVVNHTSEDIKAIQTFNARRYDEMGILKVELQKKHKILFIMGVFLLLGILSTAGLGLAMVLGERQVFMWHMGLAGITVTLAIVHAVTSMIWFFPF